MNWKGLLVWAFVLQSFWLIGQQTVITGHVLDHEDAPVIGANILIEGSYDGTSTDVAGHFVFVTELLDTQILQCSYLGLHTMNQAVYLKGDTIRLGITLVESAIDMGEVTITAGTFAAGGKNKSEVLKPLDIVTTAGATADLAGALNTLPGTVTVGESGRLFVRGGEGYETKTFIDGMQVLSFYGPTAPNTPSRSRFLPFMFRGMSFSTGGYSAEYGQALSSALILHSKPIATLERVDISLLSVGGDLSFTKTWDNASISGKLQYTNIDPYFSVINQSIDWVDPPTSLEAMAAYRAKLGKHSIVKLYGNINRSSFQLNQEDLLHPEVKIPITIDNEYRYLNGTFGTSLNRDWNLFAGISLTHNENEIGLDQDQIDDADWGFHGKLRLSREISNQLTFRLGLEHYVSTFYQDFENALDGTAFRRDLVENLTTSFIESDVRFSHKWQARIGLRSEYRAQTNVMHIMPRVSIGFKTGVHGQLSAAFGSFYQQPQNNVLVVANNLNSEQAVHYMLNYQIMKGGRTFRIEAYHKDYHRLVKYRLDLRQSPLAYGNGGSGYARGLDLFWRDSRTIPQVDYWVSYSFLDTRRNYLDFPVAVQPPFASSHNLSVVYKQFINAIKSQIGWTFSYTSGRTYRDPNEASFLSGKTKSYQDLSINLSHLLKQNVILHGSVSNVFGRDHIFGYTFSNSPNSEGIFPGRPIRPPAKRFLFLGVFITFSKQQIMNQLPNL